MRKIKLGLEISTEINDILEQIAEESGCTKSDVLRKAIAMIKVAHEAKAKGLKVGTAKADQELHQEFVNF